MRKVAIPMLAMLLTISGTAWSLGGNFTLTADDGSRYSLTDSQGKAVILIFGYTFCPDICPTALATIGAALNGLGPQAKQVDALFVSLDPDRDTPEVLRNYTHYFDPRIHGLTGSAETLAKIAKAYRVQYSFVDKGKTPHYTMDHSAQYYIIDRNGKLVQMVPHGVPPGALINSLQRVLAGADTPSQKSAGADIESPVTSAAH
jgi:protein SCO1